MLGDRVGPRAWVEYAGYRSNIALLGVTPGPARRMLAGGIARLAMTLDSRHSTSARAFLSKALGGASLGEAAREQLVRAAWRHLVEVVFDDALFNHRVLGPSLRDHFEIEFSDGAREALTRGSGGFFVVPHVGMWEAMPAIAADLGFRPAYVVSRPPRNRPLSRFAQRAREARGYRLLERRGAVDDIKTVIEAGGWVGLMLDQRPFDKTIVAPFFGHPAHCERTAAVLVRRLRRPVVFGACYRTERPFHYLAVIDRVLWPEELARLDPTEIVSRINREMERQILRAPEQYLWFHDRYRSPRIRRKRQGRAGASAGARPEPAGGSPVSDAGP